jgi:hypothetical protein
MRARRLLALLLMTVETTTLLPLVRGDLPSLPLLSARHRLFLVSVISEAEREREYSRAVPSTSNCSTRP